MTQFDWAVLILRVGIGLIFLAHGIKHARGREKTTRWFGSIGFRSPEMQWAASTLTEIGVGILLILGLLTSLAAAGLVATMFVAFWSVHRYAGFWVTARPDEGWEFVATLALGALAVAIAGPGQASIDDAIGLAVDLDGWIGLLLVAGALVLAAGQIATFYRPAEAGEAGG